MFQGHVTNQTGIHAAPDKTSAIQEMKPLTTMPELRHLTGMVNQLSTFTSHLAHLTQPLWELLSKDDCGELIRTKLSFSSMIQMLKPRFLPMRHCTDWE